MLIDHDADVVRHACSYNDGDGWSEDGEVYMEYAEPRTIDLG